MQENCEKKQILEGENMKIMKKTQILEKENANFGGRFCKKDQKWGKKEEDEDPG